jgi:dihydrofolate reductase
VRKINVLEFVSLDGVVQAPGGPKEDTSGGFAYGGWTSPHSDPVSSTAMRKQMNMPSDLLLGRKTFETWASKIREICCIDHDLGKPRAALFQQSSRIIHRG